jgi:hypothetical protein
MVGSRGERGDRGEGGEAHAHDDGTVSLMAEVPETLLESMRTFIDHHPHWDQYRLVQAALAGFLVQHGCQDRAITRCYLANLFPGQSRFHGSIHETPRKRRPHTTDTGWRPEVRNDWEAA